MRADRFPSEYRRVVIDTNVLLSSMLRAGSVPARVVDQILAHGSIVFSQPTFAELEARIWKPKFDRYISMERRTALLHGFSAAAVWVEIPQADRNRSYSRDPDDDEFVRAAVAAHAVRIISGDGDLLSLDPVGDLRIVTPRAAVTELTAAGRDES